MDGWMNGRGSWTRDGCLAGEVRIQAVTAPYSPVHGRSLGGNGEWGRGPRGGGRVVGRRLRDGHAMAIQQAWHGRAIRASPNRGPRHAATWQQLLRASNSDLAFCTCKSDNGRAGSGQLASTCRECAEEMPSTAPTLANGHHSEESKCRIWMDFNESRRSGDDLRFIVETVGRNHPSGWKTEDTWYTLT